MCDIYGSSCLGCGAGASMHNSDFLFPRNVLKGSMVFGFSPPEGVVTRRHDDEGSEYAGWRIQLDFDVLDAIYGSRGSGD